MSALSIGYARVSTEGQDLTVQRDALAGIVTLAELTERARRAVGLWPSDESAKALEEALVEVARGTADPEQASRLRRIAEALGGLARDVSVEVAAAVASRMTGFG